MKRGEYIGMIVLMLVSFVAACLCTTSVRADDIAVIYSTEYLEARYGEKLKQSPVDNMLVLQIEPVPDEVKAAAEERSFKYLEELPIDREVQKYIWDKCGHDKEYYALMLGAIELESSFDHKATGHNSNGSVDRGLCQINSSNISNMKRLGLIGCKEDLYDIYKNIDCAFYLMDKYVGMFGPTEAAYYAYNTGREHEGSNKNSRAVMQLKSKWRELIG